MAAERSGLSRPTPSAMPGETGGDVDGWCGERRCEDDAALGCGVWRRRPFVGAHVVFGDDRSAAGGDDRDRRKRRRGDRRGPVHGDDEAKKDVDDPSEPEHPEPHVMPGDESSPEQLPTSPPRERPTWPIPGLRRKRRRRRGSNG